MIEGGDKLIEMFETKFYGKRSKTVCSYIVLHSSLMAPRTNGGILTRYLAEPGTRDGILTQISKCRCCAWSLVPQIRD